MRRRHYRATRPIGVTDLDGTGSTEFDVFDSTENATLGCSQTVTCSLVAVPIMGVSCDADVAPAPAAADARPV